MKLTRLILIAASPVFIAGCGTFTLATNITRPGVSSEQLQLDTLTCKDKANLAQNSAANQAGDFLLGLTIVGTPFAYEKDKAVARNVFANCMTSLGYSMTMPDGTVRGPATNERISNSGTSTPTSPFAGKFSLALPNGWEQRAIPDELAKTGAFFFAVDTTDDCGVAMSAVSRNQVTDISAFAESLRAAQVSKLRNAQSSAVSKAQVGTMVAYRFTVTGEAPNGVVVTLLHTVLEKDLAVIDISAWTSVANFQAQRSSLEALASDIR